MTVTKFKTIRTVMKVGTCSESVMKVLNQAFDNPLPAEEGAAIPLAGGIAQQGYQCGMLWGATMAAGAEAHRRFGDSSEAKHRAIHASAQLVSTFKNRFHSIDCIDVSGTDWKEKYALLKSFLKGGPISCLLKTGNYSVIAADTVRRAFEGDLPSSCSGCGTGCAVKLAQMVGLEEMHQTMLAGFAGGIGLSGGGCGALAAAIWINHFRNDKIEKNFSVVLKQANRLIEHFQQLTDYEFECATITGRSFKDLRDHADYVNNGGCSNVLGQLAAKLNETQGRDFHNAANI